MDDFEAFAVSEISALARRLRDAADQQVEAARASAAAAVAAAEADAERRLTEARGEVDAMLAMAQTDLAAAVTRTREEAEAQFAAQVAALQESAATEIRELRTAADGAARTNAAFGAMIDKLRTQQTQLAADNEQLAAENAALTYERADLLTRASAPAPVLWMEPLSRAFGEMARATTIEALLVAAGRFLAAGCPDVTAASAHGVAWLPVFAQGSEAAITASAMPLTFDLCAAGERRGQVTGALSEAAEAHRAEWASALELIRAHADLRLERLLIDEKALAELRAYAQMLVDEVEYVFDADTGRAEDDRHQRLIDNLRCARQIFHQRVAHDRPSAAALLDEVIASTAARKDGTPFAAALRLGETRETSSRLQVA